MVVVMRHDGYLTRNDTKCSIVSIVLILFLDEQKGVDQSEDFRSSHSDDDNYDRTGGNDPMILSWHFPIIQDAWSDD